MERFLSSSNAGAISRSECSQSKESCLQMLEMERDHWDFLQESIARLWSANRSTSPEIAVRRQGHIWEPSMDPGLDLHTNTQTLLRTLAATGQAVRQASVTAGLAELASVWAQHVAEGEDGLFPWLVASGPAADGPVGFCMAEHAVLSARLAELQDAHPNPAWLREAELLIRRLVQHLFLEARVLQPLLDETAPANATPRADSHSEWRGKA